MQKFAFMGGLAAIALVLLPPIGTGAEHLFALHMAQHLLLIAGAAPLLVASGALDRIFRIPVVQELMQPVTAWVLFVGIFLL
ncbi:MAG TPA: cytochrome c oxidase assembly protein, partial [Rhizomicrobium sp.]|nr:cytochrome c oxidase assembly protein [Rhizomicrobium sp.]